SRRSAALRTRAMALATGSVVIRVVLRWGVVPRLSIARRRSGAPKIPRRPTRISTPVLRPGVRGRAGVQCGRSGAGPRPGRAAAVALPREADEQRRQTFGGRGAGGADRRLAAADAQLAGAAGPGRAHLRGALRRAAAAAARAHDRGPGGFAVGRQVLVRGR